MYLRVVIILLLFTLQSCAFTPQSTQLPDEIAPVVPAKKVAAVMQVVILASEDIPAYSEVARTLAKKIGRRSSVHYLSGSPLENLQTVNKFKNEENIQFVSIGLNAALAAKTLANKQVVFCQVYNHQDHALLSPKHKGVSMLPSLPKTFSVWRTLSPRTTDIGIISGPGFEDTMQAARAAAKSHGFTLHHSTVNSDKEYQYAYKNMSNKVQGYWLLPDNRVLSENTLRDIMNFSVRNSKQVAVFSDEILKLGGLFSINSDYQDIAHQVNARLEQSQTSETIPGPDIMPLDKLKLRINPVMAKNLDLKIPEQYRKFAHAL